jgi:hypothetical protein
VSASGTRWGLTRAAAGAAAACVLAATAALAQPYAEGPAALRAVTGSGMFSFTGKGTFGTVKGTVKTTVTPAVITPGQPYSMTMQLSWTETGQSSTCSPGTIEGQTHTQSQFPLVSPVRPGHGEDLVDTSHIVDAVGDTTVVWGDNVTTCGATDTVRQTDSYDVRVDGSETKGYNPTPSCVAPYPSAGTNVVGNLGPDATFEGTVAVLSINGADCTGAATTAGRTAPTYSDTFTAPGQAKPHAVAVPANRTHAEITLRWTKPTDRFIVAAVVLTPKRKTSAVSRGEKLKITFFARPGSSLGVRISNLSAGKLTFRVVSTKVAGKATVKTNVTLKA